jgi:SulP family sulfate permease
LAVGPTALLSLLTSQLCNKYGTVAASKESADVGAQAALTIGIILTIMSLLNLGNLIRYVSHPVFSGFVTGACMIIGLNQVRVSFDLFIYF